MAEPKVVSADMRWPRACQMPPQPASLQRACHAMGTVLGLVSALLGLRGSLQSSRRMPAQPNSRGNCDL